MIVYAECEFLIPTAHSLKEKRAVLQRMLTRTKQKFNVSVAEVDYQDMWQRTVIAIVVVSSSRTSSERELQKALSYLDSFPELERIATNIEWL